MMKMNVSLLILVEIWNLDPPLKEVFNQNGSLSLKESLFSEKIPSYLSLL